MDTIEFSKNLPSEKLSTIFKDYFDQHMAAYCMLNGIQFGDLDASMDTACIVYSLKILDVNNLNRIITNLERWGASMMIYGISVSPKISVNGDCISIMIRK